MLYKCLNTNPVRIPSLLDSIKSAPKYLNYRGDLSVLNFPIVSMVGTRKISDYGNWATKKIVSDLAELDVVTASGMAFGVDSLTHNLSLEAGLKTIAVLPAGLENIYPRSNYSLYKRILENGGLILSEYDDNWLPRKESFLQRNRIIAGIANVVIVVEAPIKSGAICTADYAYKYWVPLLAVPGDMDRMNSQGCNMLLERRAGAYTGTQQIAKILGIKRKPDKPETLSPEQRAFFAQVRNGRADINKLKEVSLATITELELKGVISVNNNLIKIIK